MLSQKSRPHLSERSDASWSLILTALKHEYSTWIEIDLALFCYHTPDATQVHESADKQDAHPYLWVNNLCTPPAPSLAGTSCILQEPNPNRQTLKPPGPHTFLLILKPVFTQSCTLQLLYDTFSAFGMVIATPKIMRDPDTGASKGFGFVSFDGFEASDGAIEAMNGQYLCNRSAPLSCYISVCCPTLLQVLCDQSSIRNAYQTLT